MAVMVDDHVDVVMGDGRAILYFPHATRDPTRQEDVRAARAPLRGDGLMTQQSGPQVLPYRYQSASRVQWAGPAHL